MTAVDRELGASLGSTAHGSDVVVEVLRDLGIEMIAFAPGATFRGLHDSMVHHPAAQEIVLCLHEEISVAIAHGYLKATGQMMAVAVHNVVGLQHASMAVYNAWCDQAPVLLVGGTGPVDSAAHRPWIDGIHTANPQATQIRDYTKWDDQPGSLAATPESLIRAHRLASATPPGPVYVCIDVGIQETEVGEGFRYRNPAVHAVASDTWPDPRIVDETVDRLIAARMPVLLAERVDRRQAALDALVEIAELLCAPVREIEREYNRTALCFPTDHWLNFTGVELPAEPDVALALHVSDLREFGDLSDVWVAEVSTAPLRARGWAADLQRIQPAAVTVPAAVTPMLTAVLAQLHTRLAGDSDARRRITLRGHDLAGLVGTTRRGWLEQAEENDSGQPINKAHLALVLRRAIGDRPRVVANGNLHNWLHRLWPLDRVDGYLGGSGGAGLGYGLGASIGAALAYRDTDTVVIDIQSDGDALMTPSALWTAAHYRVPLLIVMDNNRRYDNSVQHAVRIGALRRHTEQKPLHGTGLTDPVVDFAKLAESFGVVGLGPVDRRADTEGVLTKAIELVASEQRPVLVDVITTAEPVS